VDYGIWGLTISGMSLFTASPFLIYNNLSNDWRTQWADVKQSVVDKAIGQWWRRLQTCIRAEGQQFKQRLGVHPILISW